MTLDSINKYFFDIEVYPNYFLAVIKEPSKKYKIIEIKDGQKDNGDISRYFTKDKLFVGYNNLGYDAQIIEYILRNPGCTAEDIKKVNDLIISEPWPPYREWDLKTNNLDMMTVNNYGFRSAKATSLKKIEFFLRKKSIKDLPYHFNTPLKPNQQESVITYCKYDVDITEEFYEETKLLVEPRIKLTKLTGKKFTNSTEPQMAKEWFALKVAPKMGISIPEFKKLKTYRTHIDVKDIILPYIKFKSKEFSKVLDQYNQFVIKPKNGKILLKGQIEVEQYFKNEKFDFGSGGLHQCTESGVYIADKDYIILDIDVRSFYPNLAIVNQFYPGHLDQNFLDAYKQLYDERMTKYPKKDYPHINYLWKIFLNSTYGLSNSEYSPFYDAQYTAQTCINGQLTLAMLVEDLTTIPSCEILQTNTDGITIRIPRKYKNKAMDVCKNFEKTTGLELEDVEYKKMIIMDVNNYLSQDVKGKIKAKGLFETYEAHVEAMAFHKDPSANIIPIALENYFIKGIHPKTTVKECNNIHEFCVGVKGKSNFRWMLSTVENNIVKNKFLDNRMVRYYIGGDTTLSKMWLRNGKSRKVESFTSVEAKTPVTVCQTLRRADIIRKFRIRNQETKLMEDHYDNTAFPNLDKQWYLDKIIELIKQIE